MFNNEKEYFNGKQCFIFDLDGTLVDSMSYYRMISEKGYTLEKVYELIKPRYLNDIPEKANSLNFLRHAFNYGIDCYIATATDLKVCGSCIERLGFNEYIIKAFSSYDLKIRKDSPLFYETVLEKTGYNKKDVLIFEDSCPWAKTAYESGFDIVGVYDHPKNEGLKEFAVDFIFSFDELL